MPEDNKILEIPILDALKRAADDRGGERRLININRRGERLFSFTVQAVGEDTDERCRELNTNYKRNRRVGIRLPEKTNTTRYRSQLIYEATVPEDRARVWDCKEMWVHCHVGSGVDLIDKLLLAGEKDRVVEAIYDLSGFGGDDGEDDLEETVKN